MRTDYLLVSGYECKRPVAAPDMEEFCISWSACEDERSANESTFASESVYVCVLLGCGYGYGVGMKFCCF